MKLAVLISSIFLLAFMFVNYQFVLGFVGAQVEAWRLRESAAGKVVLDNPPNAIDSFENGLSDHWETRVINGSPIPVAQARHGSWGEGQRHKWMCGGRSSRSTGGPGSGSRS